MTSSLVGSEMCIRDRVISGDLKPVNQVCQPGYHVRWKPLPPSRVCAVPVSYTHLTLPTICSV
eukprot:6181401-Prorocentrum_lima.AAC.1